MFEAISGLEHPILSTILVSVVVTETSTTGIFHVGTGANLVSESPSFRHQTTSIYLLLGVTQVDFPRFFLAGDI